MCLPSESHIINGVTFRIFQELLVKYILKTFGEAVNMEVLQAIQGLKDPVETYSTANKLIKPEDTLNNINQMILEVEVKHHVRM